MKVQYVVMRVREGTPVPACAMLHKAWEEFVELQVMDRKSWVDSALVLHASVPRIDIGILVDGEIVGGLCMTPDIDPHVGPCCTVMSNYIIPEYRNNLGARLFREAMRAAKADGHKVLAYTHRERDWVYRTIYRRLK